MWGLAGEAPVALVTAAEEDIADAIDGEINDEGKCGQADAEQQKDGTTVVMEKHACWTVAGP
jgi:hypothetical protein